MSRTGAVAILSIAFVGASWAALAAAAEAPSAQPAPRPTVGAAPAGSAAAPSPPLASTRIRWWTLSHAVRRGSVAGSHKPVRTHFGGPLAVPDEPLAQIDQNA